MPGLEARPLSTTIAVTFPWGRYHATPWSRNVNEGAVDWPPSPWRLLRALYAGWRWHCPDLAPNLVEPLLGRLVVPPRYHLPAFTVAHTRHYLPAINRHEGVSTDKNTDKTLDTFVVAERGARVLIEWAVVLDDNERRLLAALCASIAYLGRAESIVEVDLLDVNEPLPDDGWLDDGAAHGQTTSVLGAIDPLDLSALVRTPLQTRKARLLAPLGTCRLSYPAPEPARPAALSHRTSRAPVERPTAIRLAITGRALPPVTAAVAIGDVLHQAVCTERLGGPTPALSGKNERNERLAGAHGHAHYLALAGAPGGKFLHTAVVWAPAGFDENDVTRFDAPIRLWAAEHVDGVRGRTVAVEAVGRVEVVAPELIDTRKAIVWRSLTPYAPVRHGGRRPLEELIAEDVAWELRYRGLPDSVAVRLWNPPGQRWLAYRRHRPRERLERARRAFGIEIELAEPITGPLVLGQLSHFGLGLFLPIPDT